MKAESSENFFSRREELLAGKSFGNLDPNELVEPSENEAYSEAEQKLLSDLQGTHTIKKISTLLSTSRNKRTSIQRKKQYCTCESAKLDYWRPSIDSFNHHP